MTHTDFEKTVAKRAIENYSKFKILPSVVCAQAILESGWGTSELATHANALFGIKAGSNWSGKTYTISTKEYIDGKYTTVYAKFRAYDSFEESIDDHSKFLYNLSRYSNIIGCTGYAKVCYYLQADGYATAPTYADSLIKIIESNGLYGYDTLANTTEKKYAPVIYKVQSGDTLTKIATQHLTTVENLVELNDIENPNLIYVGDILKLN